MNATQNSTHEINMNNNNVSEVTTVSSNADDDENLQDDLGVILSILNPTEAPTEAPKNDSDVNGEHTNKSSVLTEPTKQPLTQLALDHPDNVKKDSNESYISTTTPVITTTTLATTTSNSTGNSTETTKNLIPAATVKPSIKHKKDSQQKIIIRYKRVHGLSLN